MHAMTLAEAKRTFRAFALGVCVRLAHNTTLVQWTQWIFLHRALGVFRFSILHDPTPALEARARFLQRRFTERLHVNIVIHTVSRAFTSYEDDCNWCVQANPSLVSWVLCAKGIDEVIASSNASQPLGKHLQTTCLEEKPVLSVGVRNARHGLAGLYEFPLADPPNLRWLLNTRTVTAIGDRGPQCTNCDGGESSCACPIANQADTQLSSCHVGLTWQRYSKATWGVLFQQLHQQVGGAIASSNPVLPYAAELARLQANPLQGV